ncbi:hypothetical protein ACFL6G_05955, partial [candidate division KSB1 bacterium]
MSKKGQNNIGGITAQCWAALALFLQYLKDPNFSHIHLESSKGEDYDLVFKDGRKIICESKNWYRNFTYNNLRNVLQKIVTKKSIKTDDE